MISAGDSAKFNRIDAKLHVPIATLSAKDNVNLAKQLSYGFERSVYCYRYQTIPAKVTEKQKNRYDLLSTLFQGVKRLFVLAYFIAADDANNEASIKDNRKYFLPSGEIKNYDVLINGRNFCDQPIVDLIKEYYEISINSKR